MKTLTLNLSDKDFMLLNHSEPIIYTQLLKYGIEISIVDRELSEKEKKENKQIMQQRA